MKKLLIALLVLLLLVVGGSYIFVPDIIPLKAETAFPANKAGVHRILEDKNAWANWWPEKSAIKEGVYNYHGNDFQISGQQPISIEIPISGNVHAKTAINLLPITRDSLNMVWEGAMISSYNPFARIQAYFRARSLKADMKQILDSMQQHFMNPENIYGIAIRHETVTDSILTSLRFQTNGYPDTKQIYEKITLLKDYAKAHDAKSGFPMMNATELDSNRYDVMIAIPINKSVPNTAIFTQKKMITGAHILTAEVTGDQSKVVDAFKNVQQFVTDYQLTAPAIPFFSLITDREQQPDSKYWVTKVYFPVM